MTKPVPSAVALLLLGFAGVITLVVVELLRAVTAQPIDASLIPPAWMLATLLCVAAVPIILLVLSTASATRWLAFGIAALLALFHAAHIVEHAALADFAVGALILITMFVPSGAAAWQLWRARDSEDAAKGTGDGG